MSRYWRRHVSTEQDDLNRSGIEQDHPQAGMMAERRMALDSMAEGKETPMPSARLDGIPVHFADFASNPVLNGVPEGLSEAIVGRLTRDGAWAGPGAALVAGIERQFSLHEARAFHEALFYAVWRGFLAQSGEVDGAYRTKASVIKDGAIPVELYGSNWSFKQLHADRNVLLFSHLYGPLNGFIGGELLLLDVRAYMNQRKLGFDDCFEWSTEPTEGSKPVLRRQHEKAAMTSCGVNLGVLGPDQILFINNTPSAGILHGATPVTVTDPKAFVREYHRCSVKDKRQA
jgi:hypothetical protein